MKSPIDIIDDKNKEIAALKAEMEWKDEEICEAVELVREAHKELDEFIEIDCTVSPYDWDKREEFLRKYREVDNG